MKKMNKLLALVLALSLVLALTACSGGNGDTTPATIFPKDETTAPATTQAPASEPATTEAAPATTEAPTTEAPTTEAPTEAPTETNQSHEGDSELAGIWKFTIDYAKVMESMDPEEFEEMGDLGEAMLNLYREMSMVLVLELRGDYTCAAYIEEESAVAAVETMLSKMGDILPALTASSMGISEEDLMAQLEAAGMTKEQFVETSLGQLDAAEMAEELTGSLNLEGTYRYEGGKLYMVENGKTESGEYAVYELKGDELWITDVVNTGEGGENPLEEFKNLLPMVFVKG